MPDVSGHAERVQASGIREIVNRVVDLGGDICRLEIGEPDFPTPRHIVDAGHEAALKGARYTQSSGMLGLRTAVCAKLERVNGLRYTPDLVTVCQGAVQGFSVALAALLDPGDEVLLPDPAWPNVEMLTLLYGAEPVHYPLRPGNGFLPDPEEIDELVTERTRAIVLNTPSNPTGAVFPQPLVEALVELARRRDLVLLSDEVYDELIFEGQIANAAALDPDRVVALYSFSKTYSMTGWRVGYVASPRWLAPTLMKLQEPMISCVSQLTQAAAIAALEGPQDCVSEMRDAYRRRRDLVVSLLADADIKVNVPHGAFYVMVPFAQGIDSRVAALDLVEHGVALAPGSAFGQEAGDHARLSLASSEPVLQEGIARLVAWYRETGGGASVGRQ